MTTSTVTTTFDDALAAVGLVRNPKTQEARETLRALGSTLASQDEVKTAEGAVKRLTDELDEATEVRDSIVVRRNQAIRKAQAVGFSVTAIREELGVSRGTVQNFANATKVREDLKAGGNVNPPSIDTLYTAVSNLKPGELEVIRETAKTTGALPPKADKADPKPATAKALLTRAEGLSDALSTYVAKSSDVATLAKLVEVITHALDKAALAEDAALDVQTAEEAEDAAEAEAEDFSTDAAAA